MALIEERLRIANNDSAILLRNLAMKIQKFKVSRSNDINTWKVLTNIIEAGKEAEEKIYEKFKDWKDVCMHSENKEYLERC
jgi:hypothetical protein